MAWTLPWIETFSCGSCAVHVHVVHAVHVHVVHSVHVHVVHVLFMSMWFMYCSCTCGSCSVHVYLVHALFMSMWFMYCSCPCGSCSVHVQLAFQMSFVFFCLLPLRGVEPSKEG